MEVTVTTEEMTTDVIGGETEITVEVAETETEMVEVAETVEVEETETEIDEMTTVVVMVVEEMTTAGETDALVETGGTIMEDVMMTTEIHTAVLVDMGVVDVVMVDMVEVEVEEVDVLVVEGEVEVPKWFRNTYQFTVTALSMLSKEI